MTTEKLNALAVAARSNPLRSVAAERAGKAALQAAGWTVDLSRHYLDEAADAALLELASERALSEAISRLFSAEIVNPSENRAALHWALRSQTPQIGLAETVRVTTEVALKVAGRLANGEITASSGASFEAIVHIGIGGSDFGPRLVADAFADTQSRNMTVRFCANLDPFDLEMALDGLDPRTTLVIGISKSFGTEETLYNLTRARDWLKASVGEAWSKHMALVTANRTRALDWLGASDGLILDLPESVGGRFSIWSAGSLACMTALAPHVCKDFLEGAAEMDAHVQSTPLSDNLAVRLALLDYWNASCLGFGARVVLGYSRRLRMLSTYLQQLEMESNGKSIGPDGQPSAPVTAPLVWGGEGTIGQHSYHQWLHQGTHIMPTEFIVAPGSLTDPHGVLALKAHALAQAEVLANGRSFEEVKSEEPDLEDHIAAQKVHAGGRPSTVLSAPTLTPHALGALIALYEHRTYLAGVLWGVNSFDQWGVERGKTMAARLKPVLRGESVADDPVTGQLAKQVSR
ncbi:MAG: glucose-6-phosphate isomerase [Henriciella sp.]|nr:glucose-6-phosphate isomerase [Henriciella sp.]